MGRSIEGLRMIRRNEPPKSKMELIRSIKDLPLKTKFEVIEVNSFRDKQKLNLTYDRYIRKGSFTVVVIEG